ncbi:MAG: class I SAM-dependent methyltransferase [Pseudobdellovibrionaceae bacterium]
MDEKTLHAYAKMAETYSQDWLSQPEPLDMYQLLKKFFAQDGLTADIGCGNGRDTNWMNHNGFKALGFDSSKELIELATRLFPKIIFKQAFLPDLKEITQLFNNVLCETVIMHLPKDHIPVAIQNLKRILTANGVLYLSWRVTEVHDARHKDGRLYSAFDSQFILDQFSQTSILHFEDKISASSGKRVCRLIWKAE